MSVVSGARPSSEGLRCAVCSFDGRMDGWTGEFAAKSHPLTPQTILKVTTSKEQLWMNTNDSNWNEQCYRKANVPKCGKEGDFNSGGLAGVGKRQGGELTRVIHRCTVPIQKRSSKRGRDQSDESGSLTASGVPAVPAVSAA